MAFLRPAGLVLGLAQLGLFACGDSGTNPLGGAPASGAGDQGGGAATASGGAPVGAGGSQAGGGAGAGGNASTGGRGEGGTTNTGGRAEGGEPSVGGSNEGGAGGTPDVGGQGGAGGTPDVGGQGGAGGSGGCVDECPAEGVGVCIGGTLSQCTLQGTCLALTSPTPCPDGFCDSPTTCGVCTNECNLPQEECTDDEVRTCIMDANGCEVWSTPIACDGACVGGTCVACEASDLNACANAQCMIELWARDACYGNCGVFPSVSCLTQNCADESLALAVCIADQCPGCDTPALCEAFCERSVGCFFTANQAQCELICQYNDITYPAACGAVLAPCAALNACAQIPTNSCGYDDYACDDETQCVSMAFRCDSTPDCVDGSDEGGVCTVPACGVAERDCGTGCGACPVSPEFVGYTCAAGACVVGQCANGVPLDSACVPLMADVVDDDASSVMGVHGAVTDEFGTRRVIYSRFVNPAATSTLETLMAERAPGGSWSVETIPFYVENDSAEWVVSGAGSDIHMIIQHAGAFSVHHIFKDASGWHEEFFDFSGPAFQNMYQTVGWDADNGELVVAQYNPGRFLRRQASGWVEVPFPPGVGSHPEYQASNMVFDGGTAHFMLTGFAGFATGWQLLSCSISASAGSCVPVATSPTSREMWKSVLSIDSSGDAHVAVHGDVFGTGGPVTLFERVGGVWSGTPTTPVPGIGVASQGLDAELGRLDPTQPLFTIIGRDQESIVVARWTGEGWQRTEVVAPAGRRFVGENYRRWQLFDDANGWGLAMGTGPAGNIFVDGQLEVWSTSP